MITEYYIHKESLKTYETLTLTRMSDTGPDTHVDDTDVGHWARHRHADNANVNNIEHRYIYTHII